MKKKFLFILSCLITTMIYSQNDFSVSGGVLGAANFSKFSLSDRSTTIHSNTDYDFKPGWALGGWVNIPFSNSFSIEPQLMYNARRYFTSSTDNVLIKDGRVGYISVPLQLKFHLGDQFAIVLGPQIDFVTGLHNRNGGTAQESDFKKTSFAGFGGLELFPHGNVTLFGRYLYGFSDMNDIDDPTMAKYRNMDIQAGLKLRLFGKVTKPKYQATSTTTVIVPPPVDTDGDGITDDIDKCPTVAGVAKYNGCPIPDTDGDGINDELDKCPTLAGTAKYNGCPIPDTDGDGINDELDKCPSVAGVARYDGCPIPDRDKDGINDEEDKCPDVPGTAANNGCPEIKEVSDKLTRSMSTEAGNIQFTGRTTKFTVGSTVSLNRIVKILNENSDLKVKIEGHTDNVGGNDANMTLSTNRAEAVKTYLVNKGISADRISTQGFGVTMPIADNNTAAGRLKNRRVEIKLSY